MIGDASGGTSAGKVDSAAVSAGAPTNRARAGATQRIALPVAPGDVTERATLEALAARARAAGVRGARLQGCVGERRPHTAEGVHALCGLACLGVASVLTALDLGGFALVGFAIVLAGAAARCVGLAGLGALVPRVPSFNVILCGAGASTRRVVGATLDRGRVVTALPWVVFGCVVFAVLSLLLGATAQLVASGLLLAAALWAFVAGRPGRPDPESMEARLADAMIAAAKRLVESGQTEVAVVLSGCGAERGTGIAAFCDWWGLARESVELVVVEMPGAERADAVAALAKAGWRVTRIGAAALEEVP